jgi:AmmeMemoRadiSam system protein A
MERDTDLGDSLLAIARAAIRGKLGLGGALPASHSALAAPAATFVTVSIGDRLRGCIGSVEPRRPLGEDVRANAISAAFHDPRFSPLSAHEFASTAIDISLLGPSEPLACADEDDAVARLRPGVDGVILHCGGHRAIFLPQVWQQLPDPRAFLVALMRKAGLPANGWNADVRLSRYTVSKFSERKFLN